MASFNPLELQHQIRQNSTELASYLSDLNTWQKDIKSKESDLKAGKITLSKPSSSSASAPPVRSGQPHVTLRDTAAEDAARCELRRQEGNRLYAAGKLQEAMACYSSCVILQPLDPLPLSNRAQCSLKLCSWRAAEEDCDAALQLDPRHVKSLFRRATARKQLGKTQAALQDIKLLLQLDADNKQAKQLLAELEKGTTGKPSSGAKMEDVKQAQRQEAPAAGRPELPRRKLVIQEEDDEDEEEEKEDNSSVRAVQEERKEQLQLSTPQPEPAKLATNTAAQPMGIESISGSQRAGSAQIATVPSIVSSLPSQPPPPHSSAPVPGASTGAVSAPGASLASSSPSSVPAPSSSSSSVVRPPRSAMEFDSRYRGVRSQPAALSELLLLVPAAEYPTILRTALDASLLGNVLLAISQHLMPSAAAALTASTAERSSRGSAA